ncbi:MAG: Stk1 family PASTA domain-containing Ser/Thr kinase [Microbacteriaceae bacterium]
MSTNLTDPMIGRLIDGRYQVRSRIARGGMATVYLATDLRLDRLVAVKIMHPHLADDTQFKERFIQEARSAARLAHPNVVNVFDQGQDSDSAYLVMEYLPGITLRDLLDEYGSLTSEQTMDILEAVLSGLAAAHKAGIVHRDLKPENVMLADDGRIKIGDFGLARAASKNTATGAALLGTIAYLSPELVTRGVADTRSDIYAVGIMLYEMLTGEQPFKGDQPMQIAYQHANDSVPSPSSKNPKVPAELDELVLWATARDPEERPRDAREMLDQVRDTAQSLQSALPTGATATQKTLVLAPLVTANPDAETQVIGQATTRRETGPVTTDSASTLAVASRKRRKKGWWLFATVLLLAALAGGVGWYFGAGPGSQVIVPESILNSPPDEAAATLTELGLEVATPAGAIDSPTIPVGLVAGSTPEVGATLNRGSAVTLLLSTGPKPMPLPALVGTMEEDAKAEIDGEFSYAGSTYQFTDSPEGQVLDVLGADGASIAANPEYGELQPITLVVSKGPIPDVSGQSVEEAIDTLAAVELTASVGGTESSETIDRDLVIRAQPRDDAPVIPGSEVTLITSSGLPQVKVPNVVGMTWGEARGLLQNAGFELSYNRIADALPGGFEVESTDPPGGDSVDKGSTVSVQFVNPFG